MSPQRKNKRTRINNAKLTFLLSLVLIITISLVLDHVNYHREKDAYRLRTLSQVSTYRAQLEAVLVSNIQLIRGLAIAVAAEPNLDQTRFEQIAAPLFETSNELRNIGAAPGMVIKMTHPLKGNEKAIGLNFLENKAQREDAIKARDTNTIVMAGPLQLIQGSEALIARVPVYLPENNAFWGLLSVVLDIEKVYENSGIIELQQNYNIAIQGRNGLGKQGEFFSGDPSITDQDPLEFTLNFQGGVWQLYVIPKQGWQPVSSSIWPLRFIILTVLGLLISAFLFYLKILNREQESERMLEVMSNLAQVGAWSFNLEKKHVFWSDMTKKILEYPLDEQPKWSENLNYFKEGESREKIAKLVERAIKHGESYETELEVINANGQPVWALVHGEAEHKNGRCVRIFGSLQNIDARKKVELENRKIARFNETLASLTVSDEILNGKLSQSKELITQSICQALEVNCASIKLFNQQRTQLIQFASFNRSGSENNIPWLQETIPDFFTAIERKAIFCVDDAQQHPYLAPIKESYLQPFSVKTMLCVLIPASSGSIGIVCAEQDIVRTWSHNEESFLIAVGALIGSLYSSQQRIETEAQLVKAKEAAEQAVIAKSEFLASMSHEIRTPMNGVLGMLNIVKATQLDQQQKHHIKLAQSSAESFALKAEQNNTTLILDATHITSSEFISDPNRLRQILSNLIGNAVKFTQNGEILVTAKITHTLDATVLECAIADSGIGISAEKQPHLFDSFTQADTSTTRQYGGTGLGLAIVKQLCELMSGEVNVSSTPNKGSTFSFFIKIIPQLVQQHEAYQAIKNKRIWVIDDCLLNTTIAKKQLTRWGGKVSTICDYLSISDYINSHEDTPPNIVLVDSALFEPLYEAQALALKQFLTKSNSHLIIMAPMSYTNKNATLPLTEETLVFKPLTPFDLQNALTAKSTIEQTHVDTQLKSLAATEVMTDTLAAHVLLVEDNKINQVVTAAFLKQLNVAFEIAENGAEAVEKLNQNPANTYQLILMDCQMPTMDGYQATIAIREGKAGKVNKNITIIALTANAMQGDKDKCLATGMDDYLTKPLNATTLHSKLQQWLTSK